MSIPRLNIPDKWKSYYSEYPNGYSLLEAIIEWTDKVNIMIDDLNLTNEQIDILFTVTLPENVENVLDKWYLDGKLADLINLQLLEKKADKVDLIPIRDDIVDLKTLKADKIDLIPINDNLSKINTNLNDLVVNVRDFGAVPDWSQSRPTNSTDNKNPIKNAIEQAKNGSTLFFPKGHYYISKMFDVNEIDNLTIEGEGAVLHFYDDDLVAGTVGLLTLRGDSSKSYIKINGLEIIHEIPRSTKYIDNSKQYILMYLYDFKGANLKNLKLHESDSMGLQLGNIKSGVISDNIIYNCNYAGIKFLGCENLSVTNNYIKDIYYSLNNPDTIGYGMNLSSAGSYSFGTFTTNQNITIDNNKVLNCGRKNIDVHVGKKITITNNILGTKENLENYYGHIYAINEDDYDDGKSNIVDDIIITGNVSYGYNQSKFLAGGIYIGNSSTVYNCNSFIVSNNSFKNSHQLSILTINSTGPIKSITVDNNSFYSNYDYWNSSIIMVTGGTYIGILKISNNNFVAEKSKVLKLNDISNCIITGNYLRGNGTTSLIEATNISNLLENNNMLLLPNHNPIALRTFTNVTTYTEAT